jgi:hypothetical protein
VRLIPLGASTTIWSIVPALDDCSLWNKNWQGKPEYSEKTCHIATLPTKYPICLEFASNRGRSGGKTASKCLSYGAAMKRCDTRDVTVFSDESVKTGEGDRRRNQLLWSRNILSITAVKWVQ